MAEEPPRQPGRLDESRINIEKDYEIRYWCEKLGVTADELKNAVAEVGTLVRDVRLHLRQQN